MVESRNRIPRPQLRSREISSGQGPTLTEMVENADLNAKQRKARDVLARMDFSDPNLPSDVEALLFLCFLWHESGSVNPVKKITGIKNNVDARSLVDRVGESDNLTKQYEEFYSQYRTQVPEGIA